MVEAAGTGGDDAGGVLAVTWLSAAELHRLTGKKRYTAQCQALAARGIKFTTAANGEPLVRPQDVVDCGGKPARNRGPNWDRIGA